VQLPGGFPLPGRRASSLRRRLATAAVALPVVLVVPVLGTPAVTCLAAVAAAASGWELAGMSPRPAGRQRNLGLVIWPAALVSVAGARASGVWDGAWWPVLAALGAGGVLAGVLCAASRRREPAGWRAVAAALYVGLLLAHAPALRARADGLDLILLALLTTFAADTAAYFTGTAVGRHRMAPRISPGKTWEGFAGAVVGAVAAAAALTAVLDPGLPLWAGPLLGVAIASAGTGGDLLESALKRAAGLKDSGSLLPGHGGVLDRLDSLAPNLAVVYWFAVAIAG